MAIKGSKISAEHKKKISDAMKGGNSGSFKKGVKGELNVAWKGDKVGYWGIHAWLYREYGKAESCDFCETKTAKKYEWANKSHEYRRDRDDWLKLCARCHAIHDERWINRERNGKGQFI